MAEPRNHVSRNYVPRIQWPDKCSIMEMELRGAPHAINVICERPVSRRNLNISSTFQAENNLRR
jgi:hypothetical protein